MLVGVYATEDAHTRVRVNLFNPGPICTWECAARSFRAKILRSRCPAHGEALIGLALPSAP